jgi:parvulin-like peptidyl-prolyl isomerase
MKPLLLLFLAALALFAQQPPAAEADPVVLTVGNERVTKSQFEQIIATFNEQQRSQLQAPEARRQLAEQIAELKMMAQEGRMRGLDQSPALRARVALQAEQALATAVYQDMVQQPPDEAVLQRYYEEHKQEWEEATGRHILIRMEGSRMPAREGQPELTDEQALAKTQELRAKIVAGGDFAEIAKAESDDRGSGENGGDLGPFAPGQMVEEFDAAAFSIPVGEVSQPIKTAYGYHLILVESRGAKAFDEVRPQILQAVTPEIGQAAVEALKAKTTITLDDGYFGDAPVPPPPPPAQ